MTFANPDTLSPDAVEEGAVLAPRFNTDGLIPAIAQDAATGDVLMMAWMNADALNRTLETGKAHYWSRSRNSLWLKGETSGQVQTVEEILTDCDQDTLLLRVRVGGDGGCCHVGYRSCFYRAAEKGQDGKLTLKAVAKKL